MRVRLLAILALTVASAASASAQSLADLARKEESRRKQLKQSSKVLTNKDLRPTDHPPPPPPVSTTPAPAPGAGPDAPPAKSPGDLDAEQAQKDEQAWRQKMKDARLALERNQMYADALQSKINALWADFTARDDPAQRAQIELERKRALAEQERVKGEIEAQKKAVADLEEEARKAGVPPGWIR